MFTVAKRDVETQEKRGKEAIHSGHFMVSHFEAEEQDDEYELAVPIPEPEVTLYKNDIPIGIEVQDVVSKKMFSQQPLTIDTSLSKLFQCMSIAYRQKLTSPKWNRFRGIRLRWKDKIRLNNVIWRCWHMQFIKKINTDICQFASPLDVDTHNKPEAIVLEGKYWKRKLAAVTAEYKKWRMFYRTHVLGHAKDTMETLSDLDTFAWHSQSSDSMHMMVDEDYLGLMSDTLFTTITNQPFVFPDSREIARAGLADFIQPSLGPLQPNLDDYMDTFEPLQEFISGKLPTVPEENGTEWNRQQNISWSYADLDIMNTNASMQMNALSNTQPIIDQYNSSQSVPVEKQVPIQDTGPQITNYPNEMMIHPIEVFLPQQQQQQQAPQPSSPIYQPPVISKANKSLKKINQSSMSSTSTTDTMYPNYTLPDICAVENRLQLSTQPQTFKLPQSSDSSRQVSQGYKFNAPTNVAPNFKFTSQTPPNSYKTSSLQHLGNQAAALPINSVLDTPLQVQQKDVKTEGRMRSSHSKGNRQRSISMSREPVKRPPLLSAISDPSLVTPANSVLLTKLLTNNTPSNVYAQNQNLGVVAPPEQSSSSVRVKEELSVVPQPQAGPATLIITTPVGINPSQSSISDPLLLTSLGASNSSSPSSSQGIGSCPTSPQGALGSPTRDFSHKDQRRVGHIHAEQKRRYNIKNGFDVLHSLIPHLNQNPNSKLSKAALLQKGAEYIRQLQHDRDQLKDEMSTLKQQIEALNTSISNCQSLLPATGAPVSRRRDSKMQEMFDDYVKKRTMEDWKFWIFSLFIRPLLISFNNFVSTSSLEDLYRSTLHWVEQHCTLVDLRPVVLNSLRYLCTKTDILSEPEKLPEEARQAVMSSSNSSNQNV